MRRPPSVFALAGPGDDAATTSRRPELSWQRRSTPGSGWRATTSCSTTSRRGRPARGRHELHAGRRPGGRRASLARRRPRPYGHERTSATHRFIVDTTPPAGGDHGRAQPGPRRSQHHLRSQRLERRGLGDRARRVGSGRGRLVRDGYRCRPDDGARLCRAGHLRGVRCVSATGPDCRRPPGQISVSRPRVGGPAGDLDQRRRALHAVAEGDDHVDVAVVRKSDAGFQRRRLRSGRDVAAEQADGVDAGLLGCRAIQSPGVRAVPARVDDQRDLHRRHHPGREQAGGDVARVARPRPQRWPC